jgi:two-component system response regulator FixJ
MRRLQGSVDVMDAPLNRTVYVIDDDDVVRDSLTALLEAHNFTTVAFESGQKFLTHRVADGANCLILDVHMPEMTGVEVLQELRERGIKIPVILITGRRDPGVQAQAQALGASALLDKPLVHRTLFAAIEKALAGQDR